MGSSNPTSATGIHIPRYYKLSKFVRGNGTDEITGLQLAIDTCEQDGRYLVLDVPVTMQGTLYLGNVVLENKGSSSNIISVVSNASWQKLGTANRRTAAAILTKASTGALYGATSSSPSFQGVEIDFTNTADANAITTCMLMDLWQNASNNDFTVKSVGCTATAVTTPLDFYSGCKDLSFNGLEVDNSDVVAGAGGVWVRNYSSTVNTDNINFTQYRITNNTPDEAVAVYDPPTLAYPVKNIVFDGGVIRNMKSGQCFKPSNNNALSDNDMSGVIKNTTLIADTLTDTISALSFEDCPGWSASDVKVVVKDVAAGASQVFGVRGLTTTVVTGENCPSLERVEIIADGVPTNNILWAFVDYLNLKDCKTTAINSGYMSKALKRLRGRVDGGTFGGTKGRCAEDNRSLRNITLLVDADVETATYPIQNNSNAYDVIKLENVEIKVSGTTTVQTGAAVMSVASASTIIDVNGVYMTGTTSNLSGTPANTVGATPKVARWENMIFYDGTTFTRDTQTIDI